METRGKEFYSGGAPLPVGTSWTGLGEPILNGAGALAEALPAPKAQTQTPAGPALPERELPERCAASDRQLRPAELQVLPDGEGDHGTEERTEFHISDTVGRAVTAASSGASGWVAKDAKRQH